MSTEWKCRQCGHWIDATYLSHFLEIPAPPFYERHVRAESDPIREAEEARRGGPSRWFVVYYRPVSAGLRWGGRFHKIEFSDDQTLRWPHGWSPPIFTRQIPEYAWDIDLFTLIELYETGRLDRSSRVRIPAAKEQLCVNP